MEGFRRVHLTSANNTNVLSGSIIPDRKGGVLGTWLTRAGRANGTQCSCGSPVNGSDVG